MVAGNAGPQNDICWVASQRVGAASLPSQALSKRGLVMEATVYYPPTLHQTLCSVPYPDPLLSTACGKK